MKGCIFQANLEGQGCYSKMFSILLILIWELRYPQKRGVNKILHFSEYVRKNFLEELAFLKSSETFEKLLQPVAFIKMRLFHRDISAIF